MDGEGDGRRRRNNRQTVKALLFSPKVENFLYKNMSALVNRIVSDRMEIHGYPKMFRIFECSRFAEAAARRRLLFRTKIQIADNANVRWKKYGIFSFITLFEVWHCSCSE